MRVAVVVTLLLLLATATAFVSTQRQKLEPSPLTVLQVDETFAPTCRCATSSAAIQLELRRRSDITLAIVDANGHVVRTLIDDRRPEGVLIAARWDGRDDGGRVVPEGDYRPRLRVEAERRTFILTNRMTVDTTRPTVTLRRVEPAVIERVGDRISISFVLSERAQPFLLVNGRLQIRGASRRGEAKLDWYGRREGRLVPNGRYRLQLSARDVAGNVAERTPPVVVRIRR